MRTFFAFWKKDIINKFIVLISFGLVAGAFVIAYLLVTMKSDSNFYAVFGEMAGVKKGVPTMVSNEGNTMTVTTGNLSTSFANTSLPSLESPTQIIEHASAMPASPTVIPTSIVAVTGVTPTRQPLPTLSPAELLNCIPNNPPQTGKVLDVIDGNTIRVMINGATYTVRYLGIEVPKYRPVAEYYGQQADFKNAEYVFAKDITLIADARDKDDVGRLLRYVRVGEMFVNYELVRQGFAKAGSAPFACLQTFQSAENAATQEQLGIWKLTPTPPIP